eukprot:4510257-Pyramimonas_sp.AAC.1
MDKKSVAARSAVPRPRGGLGGGALYYPGAHMKGTTAENYWKIWGESAADFGGRSVSPLPEITRLWSIFAGECGARPVSSPSSHAPPSVLVETLAKHQGCPEEDPGDLQGGHKTAPGRPQEGPTS